MTHEASHSLKIAVPPRGYGDAPDDVREATARSLFEEVDVKMMEIFSDASGKEDAFLLITPAEYMQLVHRAEAALKYTKDPNLVEQVEMLVGAILDMKEAVTEVDTADAGGPGEEEAEEEEEALSAVQRIEAAASLVSEADSLFEICDIEGAIVKAKEAADLAVEGSKEWEEALLILGQGYQRVQNDVESSKVFQILRDRGLSKKNRQLAAQLQAIAEAPELAMKTENISSIRSVVAMSTRCAVVTMDLSRLCRPSSLLIPSPIPLRQTFRCHPVVERLTHPRRLAPTACSQKMRTWEASRRSTRSPREQSLRLRKYWSQSRTNRPRSSSRTSSSSCVASPRVYTWRYGRHRCD